MGVSLYLKITNKYAWQHFVARLTSFAFAIINTPFTDKKKNTEQMPGSETQPFSSVLQNQGNTSNIVILSCFWYIPQYGSTKIKDTGRSEERRW